MQILLKINRTTVYNIKSSDTIQSLKDQIYDKECIKENLYYLSWSGKILDSNKLVSDYLIEELSTIYLNFRLCPVFIQ